MAALNIGPAPADENTYIGAPFVGGKSSGFAGKPSGGLGSRPKAFNGGNTTGIASKPPLGNSGENVKKFGSGAVGGLGGGLGPKKSAGGGEKSVNGHDGGTAKPRAALRNITNEAGKGLGGGKATGGLGGGAGKSGLAGLGGGGLKVHNEKTKRPLGGASGKAQARVGGSGLGNRVSKTKQSQTKAAPQHSQALRHELIQVQGAAEDIVGRGRSLGSDAGPASTSAGAFGGIKSAGIQSFGFSDHAMDPTEAAAMWELAYKYADEGDGVEQMFGMSGDQHEALMVARQHEEMEARVKLVTAGFKSPNLLPSFLGTSPYASARSLLRSPVLLPEASLSPSPPRRLIPESPCSWLDDDFVLGQSSISHQAGELSWKLRDD